MSDLTRVDGRTLIGEIKQRLKDDTLWEEMVIPEMVERTRWGLTTLVTSLNDQQAKATARPGDFTARWLDSVTALKKYALRRLEALPTSDGPVVSGNREARAWRAYAARLAAALRDGDQEALDRLQTPYGGLTAAQWLVAREHKEMAS